MGKINPHKLIVMSNGLPGLPDFDPWDYKLCCTKKDNRASKRYKRIEVRLYLPTYVKYLSVIVHSYVNSCILKTYWKPAPAPLICLYKLAFLFIWWWQPANSLWMVPKHNTTNLTDAKSSLWQQQPMALNPQCHSCQAHLILSLGNTQSIVIARIHHDPVK